MSPSGASRWTLRASASSVSSRSGQSAHSTVSVRGPSTILTAGPRRNATGVAATPSTTSFRQPSASARSRSSFIATLCQPHDRQLGRRPPDERRERAQVVRRLRRERRLRPPDRGEARLPLEPARAAPRPDADDLPFRDPDRALADDQAHLHLAQPLHPLNLDRDILERGYPVPQPSRIFEAEIAREAFQLRAELRQRVVQRLPLDALERARRELRLTAARHRPEVARLRRAHDRVAATAEIDVAIGPRGARVRGRPQLADEAELLERRLDLRRHGPPFDPVQRPERRLDRRALPVGPEVRPEPGAQVSRAAD